MRREVQEQELVPTRPYLIRAIYEWCTVNGLTPHLVVRVDERTQVPFEHVRDNEIVLNISHDATGGLKLGNDWIEFKARFSGVARDILVPVDHVMAIYARENGQGMAFQSPGLDPEMLPTTEDPSSDPPPEPSKPTAGRPALRRVK